MPNLPAVRTEIAAPLALLTLVDRNGDKRLTPEGVGELSAGIAESFADPAVRVLVLRAEPGVFCRGMDLGRLVSESAPVETVREAAGAYFHLLEEIHCGPKPVVAVVEGGVAAGGVGLVAACDVVVAGPEVTFELSEVYFGLIPANIAPFIAARIGTPALRRLMVVGDRFPVDEAAKLGLVDYPCDDEATIEKTARRLLRSLLRAEPDAVAEAKRMAAEIEGLGRHREMVLDTLIGRIARPATMEGLAALADGSSPPWFAKPPKDISIRGR